MSKMWKSCACVVVLVSMIGLLAACTQASAQAPAASQPKAAKSAAVKVAMAQKGDVSQVLAYSGSLQAKDSVRVMPLASGHIGSVSVSVGDELKAGDEIAQIENDVYAAQTKQAEAALQAAQYKLTRMQQGSRVEEIAAAQAAVRAARTALNAAAKPTDDQRTIAAANMDKAEAALKLAQYEYDKVAWAGQAGMTQQALVLEQATIGYQSATSAYNLTVRPTDGQLAPLESQLAQAELRLALTKQPYIETDFAMARAAVDQAQAALKQAQTQLDYTTIRAPFDGVVAEVYVTQGSLVGPAAPVALFVSKELEVMVDIEESRVGRIQGGQSAALRVAAYPGQDFPAVVTTIAPVGDSRTHNFAIKVVPADNDHLLRSGMFASVAILAETRQGALLVPRTALVPAGERQTVYVVKDGQAALRTVTVGLVDDTRAEVLSGLAEGEQVVIAGQSTVQDGGRVEVVSGS